MFYEYAVEPAALSSWERARFFLDAFGPWKGRFLAECPGHWKRAVYESLDCPDMEKKLIETRLSQVDKRIFSSRTGARYDGTKPWLDNAELEHQRVPFRAIIAIAPSEKPYMLDAAEIDERHERWRVDAGRLVPRDAGAFAEALQLLLAQSKRVVIVDPYFRADQDDKTRPLVAFCKLVRERATVEVHFAEVRGYGFCMQDAERTLPKILPTGMRVMLHCWKEKDGGPRLHNRYILTEVGGVQFGDSIEIGNHGQGDRISILDEPSRVRLWNEFLGSPPAYDKAGAPKEFSGK